MSPYQNNSTSDVFKKFPDDDPNMVRNMQQTLKYNQCQQCDNGLILFEKKMCVAQKHIETQSRTEKIEKVTLISANFVVNLFSCGFINVFICKEDYA